MSISKVLAPRDCAVDYAPNGFTGMTKAQQKNFDLIILDIHLPDIDGIRVCRVLKQLPAYEHRPILLLTSDQRNLEDGLLAGASDYILKPFNPVEMIARVFTQINLSRSRLSINQEMSVLESNLRRQQCELEEAQHDLQKYFYQTSHKLRAPLNSMKGIFDLMRREYPETSNNPYIPLLEKSVASLAYINEQVSRIGHLRTIRPLSRTFNLAASLAEIVQGPRYRDYQIQIAVDPSLTLCTDLDVFCFGIEPILDNAIAYARGTDSPTIHVTSVLDDRVAKLVIHDKGLGMSAENAQHACDMFFIGNEKAHGNGLGLYISRVALHQIGMSLEIQSKEGLYTSVIVDLASAVKHKYNTNEAYGNCG